MKVKVCQWCLKFVKESQRVGEKCCHCGHEGSIKDTELVMPKGYEFVACEGQAILAKSECGTQWVTWAVCPEINGETGVTWGHYYDNEIGAMEDYIKRCK